jgi:hypothetical protein
MAPQTAQPAVDDFSDPHELTIESLKVWPDEELFSLIRAGAEELRRRQMPVPVALPLMEVAAGILGISAAVL